MKNVLVEMSVPDAQSLLSRVAYEGNYWKLNPGYRPDDYQGGEVLLANGDRLSNVDGGYIWYGAEELQIVAYSTLRTYSEKRFNSYYEDLQKMLAEAKEDGTLSEFQDAVFELSEECVVEEEELF